MSTLVQRRPTGNAAAVTPEPVEEPHWAMLPVVLTGTFMTTLDFFIVNVALPSIQRELGASDAAIQFVVAAFGLALGSALITAGRLGDQYGRRRVLCLGIVLFTLASAACGLAQTDAMLIASRAVQGLAAALISPQVLAILGVSYSGASRARAFTAYGLTLGLAAVAGQLVGGLLIQANIAGLGWRNVFLINLPVGVVTLALTPLVVPPLAAKQRSRLDVRGALLVEATVVAIVLPLIEGRQQHWPLWSWSCLAAAVPLLLAFLLHEQRLRRRGGAPLVDLTLFRERSFSLGLLAQLALFMTQASFYFVFALYVQQGRGLDALHAGAAFMPIGVGYLVTSLTATRLINVFGSRVLPAGALVMAAGHAALLATVVASPFNGSPVFLAPALVVCGAGLGMVLSPLVAAVLARVPAHHAGAASGVLSTTMQVGNVLGVAIIGLIFFGRLGSAPSVREFAPAFSGSLVYLAATTIVLAALLQLLLSTHRPSAEC